MSGATETIAAVCTPPGEGAVAMLRISGPEAFVVAKRFFRSRVPFEKMRPRHLYFGHIVEEAVPVDEGLCAIFHAPASYTGENLVEVSYHGGVVVSAQVLRLALDSGARLAHPGEFTQRAFLNGKMDLTRAEAIMDLIQAQTLQAMRAAALQLDGSLSRAIATIRSELIHILSHIEASIDFPEDGIEPDTGGTLLKRIFQVRQQIDTLLSTENQGRLLREGIQLTICGPPNAGKSSLLNQLLKCDRAIVSHLPGTTRDTLEESASLKGMLFRITDTAGIHLTSDLIELEGIRRSFAAAEKADVILYVVDAAQSQPPFPPAGLPEDKLHLVWNKIDLLTEPFSYLPTSAAVSCRTGAGVPQLISKIIEWAGGLGHNSGQSVAINARHQSCLKRAMASLEHASELAIANGVEFIAFELYTALDAIGEVTGAVDHKEVLDSVFSNFCIGK
jgi:tRNA modification GTPase